VPAGFRWYNIHKQQFVLHSPSRTTANLSSELLGENISSTSTTDNTLIDSMNLLPATAELLHPENTSHPTHSTNPSSLPIHIPIVRSVDKASSSLPKKMTMSEDFLRSCVGYRHIDTLKKQFNTLYQDTVQIDHTPPDAVLDPGCFASMHKKDWNTSPVLRPSQFGDVFHIAIIFGPEISIGDVHYGLLCVDGYSHMTYLYPLKNLTSDIPKQLELFFSHLGMIPCRIILDFDMKLIGGKAREYLNSLLVHVNAAPSYRQDKNGLAECHWQTLISMARNWLVSSELPPSFWFYAVR
jgi:hypothetical protein